MHHDWWRLATPGPLCLALVLPSPLHPSARLILVDRLCSQLKGVPLVGSSHHCTIPPSPLHNFLAALGYRSQYIAVLKAAEGLLMAKNRRQTRKKGTKQSRRHLKRIDVLPDDILLEMFDFYVGNPSFGGKSRVEEWQLLVHVCRRWRNLVLGSPLRLNLRLYCTPQTPARDTLHVWPAFPLIVDGYLAPESTDNVITTLSQSNRVCQVSLYNLAGRQLEQVLAAMELPFPELTGLRLSSDRDTPPVIPDSFLGRSAPCLRIFTLEGIPFPGLPKVLLSSHHLVSLHLYHIPHSGYISPEAIVGLISELSSLEWLDLEFESPRSCPDSGTRRTPPSKRSVIPALSSLYFKGVTEYLEDLVARIDTPQLNYMDIRFFNQINFDTPRLAQFINCTPTLRARDGAHVRLSDFFARVELQPELWIAISCQEPDWQLSFIEQVCNSSLNPLPTVEDLYIEHEYSKLVWKNDAIENTLWLQLLVPFIAVKNLYLSKDFSPGIAAALQGLVGGRITEVLPSLQKIFVKGLESSGSFQENIGQFVAARQLSGHNITISDWVSDRVRLPLTMYTRTPTWRTS